MITEPIHTVEEVAQHLRVPVGAVDAEIEEGRLEAISVGKLKRISESELIAFKSKARSRATGSSIGKPAPINLAPTADFTYTWPNNTKEEYTNVQEGVVQHSGRDYAVKIGFTIRESAGKRRRRSLVIVNRYPTVEFVASDTASGNIQMAGIIKDRRGKQLPKRAVPPPEYAGLSVGPYRDIVDGPGASNGLAVICASDDLATMVQHALIRYKYRQERASKS